MFNASVTTHHFLCLRIGVNGWIFGPCVNILQNVNSSLAGGEFAAAAGQLSQFWGKEKTGERGETIYTRTCTRTVCIPTLLYASGKIFRGPVPIWQLDFGQMSFASVSQYFRTWVDVRASSGTNLNAGNLCTVLYLLNITVLCDVVNYEYVERHILNFMQRIHL